MLDLESYSAADVLEGSKGQVSMCFFFKALLHYFY